MFSVRKMIVAALLLFIFTWFAEAQTNPGFIDGATLCANYPNTNCSNTTPTNPLSLNQAFMNKADYPLSNISVASANPPILCNGQDQTANLLAVFAAHPNGAMLSFQPCTYTFSASSGIVMPNNGASTMPTQASYWFLGAGETFNGYQHPMTGPNGGTVFSLGGTSQYGMIQTFGGNAVLGARNITFVAGGSGSGNPFVYTTSTTLDFENVSFLGPTAMCNISVPPTNDVFIFGAMATGDPALAFPNGPTAAFQGYGTRISHVYADRIRRFAVAGTFSNSVHIDHLYLSPCAGNNLYGASTATISGGAIVTAGTGYAVNDRYLLAGGTVNSGTQIVITSIGAGGAVTGAHVAYPGGYVSVPSNPVAIAQKLCDGPTSGVGATCIGTGATFNLTYSASVGAAIDITGLDAFGWYVQADILDMSGYFYGVNIGSSKATVNVVLDDVRNAGNAASVAGLRFLYLIGGGNFGMSTDGPSPFIVAQEDNNPGGCATNVIIPLSGGNPMNFACFPYQGNLVIPSSPNILGTAGSTNELRLLQTSSYFDLYTDGTNGFLSNFGSGDVYIQSEGNGNIYLNGKSSTTIVSLFNTGKVVQFNGYTTPGLLANSNTGLVSSSAGVACSGTPTALFATNSNGQVTHC